MSQEIHEHLTGRLRYCENQLERLSGSTSMDDMRRRAILSVKIASLKSRIQYLNSDVKVYLPNYSLIHNQIPIK